MGCTVLNEEHQDSEDRTEEHQERETVIYWYSIHIQ
jgi:hypothetical protein